MGSDVSFNEVEVDRKMVGVVKIMVHLQRGRFRRKLERFEGLKLRCYGTQCNYSVYCRLIIDLRLKSYA